MTKSPLALPEKPLAVQMMRRQRDMAQDDRENVVLTYIDALLAHAHQQQARADQLAERVRELEENYAIIWNAEYEQRQYATTLAREVEEFRKDARRYRWLRGNNSNWHVEHWDGGNKTVRGTWRVISESRLDAAIDAAHSDDAGEK